MASVDIRFPGNVAQVSTISALRAIPSYMVEPASLYVAKDAGRAYTFDFGSLLPDDGADVVKPNDRTSLQAGRWIYEIGGFAPGPSGPSNNTRTTLVELKAASISDRTSLFDNSLWTWAEGNYSNTPAARIDVDVVQSNSQPLTMGAWIRAPREIYGEDFGTRGDGVADDTIPLQNALNAAKALGIGIVRMRYQKNRITGPIYADGVGLVYDAQGFGPGDPGIYPDGSGYTAVTLSGFIPDWRCGAYAIDLVPGVVPLTFDANNTITSDTRPNITAFQISQPQDVGVAALSHISWMRAVGFPRGVVIKGMWDTNISKLSVEYCGGDGVDDYAIDIQDGGFPGQTTNESVISYLQCEHAANRAIRISVNLLSTRFGKIHSERAYAKTNVNTWVLSGGGCIYDTVRLDASVGGNPSAPRGKLIAGGSSTEFRAVRLESADLYYSVLPGGTVTFNSTEARVYPSPGQNGRVIFRGGSLDARDIDAYATFDGVTLISLICGFAAGSLRTTAMNCEILSLSNSSTQAALDCVGGTVKVAAQSFRSIRFMGGCEVSPTSGSTLGFGYQHIVLDETSTITSNLNLDFAGFDWRGSVLGAVSIATAARTIVGADARNLGGVTGFVPSTGTEFIGPIGNATRTKNPQWAPGGIPGWLYNATGTTWVPEPVV